MHDWDPDPQHTTPPPVVDLLGRMRVLAADEGGDAGLLGVPGRRVGHISSQEDHRLVEAREEPDVPGDEDRGRLTQACEEPEVLGDEDCGLEAVWRPAEAEEH